MEGCYFEAGCKNRASDDDVSSCLNRNICSLCLPVCVSLRISVYISPLSSMTDLASSDQLRLVAVTLASSAGYWKSETCVPPILSSLSGSAVLFILKSLIVFHLCFVCTFN